MPRKIRQLKRDLRRAGALMIAEEGDHEKWKTPLVPIMTSNSPLVTETTLNIINIINRSSCVSCCDASDMPRDEGDIHERYKRADTTL